MDTRLLRNDKKNGYDKLNQGFTLVELSIVLLVIGLLVGGVLVGRDMIRAAELRSITTQKDQLQTSVMLFQDKYHGLPGDLKNATAFWGVMPTGTCNTTGPSGASGATGTQTCNGNGDGMIEHVGLSFNYRNAESFLFWQHMSNAGLVEGKYTGVCSGTWGIEGQEMKSKIKNIFWQALYYGILPTADLVAFEGNYGHSLNIYKASSINNVLTPTEAWGIDKKIDDGMPGLGTVVTLEHNGVNCNNVAASASAIAATATYNLDYESAACRLFFKNMW